MQRVHYIRNKSLLQMMKNTVFSFSPVSKLMIILFLLDLTICMHKVLDLGILLYSAKA